MEISKHSLIPKHVFVTIINKSSAIDNVLSLHYTTHTSHPPITKIITQASSLAKCAIIMKDIEQMLEINPSVYLISRLDDELSIKFPRNTQVSRRKEQFINSVNQWIQSHQNLTEIPATSKTIVNIQQKSPNKIVKSRSSNSSSSSSSSSLSLSSSSSPLSSPTKNRSKIVFSDLKNDSSKFKFIEKSESVQSNKHDGLSLLERIRLKEKLKKEKELNEEDTVEKKYEKCLISKIPMIYDVIYQLYNGQSDICKTFSIKKLIQIIQDSSSYPIIADEIHDGMKLIDARLSKVQMIEKNGIEVIKVSHLNREEDLQVFQVN